MSSYVGTFQRDATVKKKDSACYRECNTICYGLSRRHILFNYSNYYIS